MSNQEIVVQANSQGERLDVYLARVLVQNLSRSQIKKLIEEGSIKVAGKKTTAHYHVKAGDSIQLEWMPPVEDETRAENIPIDVVFEDEELIVVNKPAGMVVHPAHGNPRHTLVNALLYHTQNLSAFGGSIRPGIVHRLDKDTSGILVIAKTNQTHAFLAKQFKKHTIERVYFAIVRGVVQHDQAICDEPVGRAFLSRKKVIVKPSGGKDAVTHFHVLKRFKNATLLEVRPQTGRTHQIRVHLTHLGYPIIGDSLYGFVSPWIARQALHAASLAFIHPKTKERMSFESPMPADMKALVSYLESEP